jgi:hypothetical protein
VHFTLGSYHDYVDCDVVPMQACSLLLGRPWQYDNSVIHHGRTNSYTIMFEGKTVNLLPMTPDEIVNEAKDKGEGRDTKILEDTPKPHLEAKHTMLTFNSETFPLSASSSDLDMPCHLHLPFNSSNIYTIFWHINSVSDLLS